MMYRVAWVQTALDELAVIWMAADSSARAAITAAAYDLEKRLMALPYQESESRGKRARVAFAAPLGFEIEIDRQNQVVWIAHVWRFRRRGE